MYCQNCGKEIEDNINICPYCQKDLKETEIINESEKETLKDHILKMGRTIIDFDTSVSIGLALLLICGFWFGVLGAFLPDENGYFETIRAVPALFITALILSIIIVILVIMSKYLIYLLIDIRDSLEEIKNNIKGEK